MYKHMMNANFEMVIFVVFTIDCNKNEALEKLVHRQSQNCHKLFVNS